jgi:hypothetical protein
MKKLLIVLILGLIINGCGKKSQKNNLKSKAVAATDSSTVKFLPVENPNQKFNIGYKFEKGKDYQYRITFSSEDRQSIKDDSSYNKNIMQNTVYILDTKLKDNKNDSVLNFMCKITSINYTANVNGKIFNYQSKATNDSIDTFKFAEYASLVNNPFSVTINKYGGVVNISKVDLIINKYIKLKRLIKRATKPMKVRLKQNIVDRSLEPLIINIFRKMPQNTIAKDSSWSDELPPAHFIIFTLNNTNTFKISDLKKYHDNLIASIKVGLKTEIKGNTTYKAGNTVYNFDKPKTSANGNIYFNISKGCIQKSKIQTEAKVFFTIKSPGKKEGSKTENMTSSNVVELL